MKRPHSSNREGFLPSWLTQTHKGHVAKISIGERREHRRKQREKHVLVAGSERRKPVTPSFWDWFGAVRMGSDLASWRRFLHCLVDRDLSVRLDREDHQER